MLYWTGLYIRAGLLVMTNNDLMRKILKNFIQGKMKFGSWTYDGFQGEFISTKLVFKLAL